MTTTPQLTADEHPTPSAIISGTGLAVGITIDGQATRADTTTYPSFRWGLAPTGVMTRRQLSAAGLRPAGTEPVARLVWRRGQRWAELYAVAAARPKRPMTPAKQRALDAAMAARRTCVRCHHEASYVIPSSIGCCLDCADDTTRQEAAA